MKDKRVKLHDRRAVQCPLAVRDDVSDEVSVLTARARVLFRVRKFHYFETKMCSVRYMYTHAQEQHKVITEITHSM